MRKEKKKRNLNESYGNRGKKRMDTVNLRWLDSLDLAFAKGQLSWAGRW